MGIGAIAVAYAVASAPAALAQSVEELNDAIQDLQRKIQQLEQRATPAQAVGSPSAPIQRDPTVPDFVEVGLKPFSFKVPGTETSMQIGGYVKGDLIYDVDSDAPGPNFSANAIPRKGTPAAAREGNFSAHARQSRLFVRTWTGTDLGELQTYIEGDFEGGGGNEILSNSSTLRLRHAVGGLDPLQVGQTWTNFMSLHTYPDTVDFFGPAGMSFLRQGQVRYTIDAKPFAYSVSLENPETVGRIAGTQVNVAESTGGIGIDQLPDLTAAVVHSTVVSTFKLSGVLRKLAVDAGIPGGADDDELGWGLHAALSYAPFGKNKVMLTGNYGDGIGRYIINGVNNDVVVQPNGRLTTQKMWSAVAAYEHHWTDTLKSVVAYGHVDFGDTFAPADTAELDTLHLNLWWQIVPRGRVGVEYIYGRREFAAGDDNDASRFQFGAQWFF